MNTATVLDNLNNEHVIECDFMMINDGRVNLYVDYRGPKSNRIEVVASFTNPIYVKFKEPPLKPGTSIYPE